MVETEGISYRKKFSSFFPDLKTELVYINIEIYFIERFDHVPQYKKR